jgi:ribosomal protein S12 methylthiotransferase
VFEFSPEEGTPAYAMKPKITGRVAKERHRGIMAAQQAISREILKGKVGRTYRVICDSVSENGKLVCRSDGQSPEIDGAILIEGKLEDYAGRFFDVQITDASEYDMRGKAK